MEMDKKKLPGVYEARKKDQTVYYRASLTFRGKHISLGSYDTMQQAHRAYKEALALTGCDAAGVEDYSPANALPFEKWVCLINFRDNRLYFSNPIYIRKNYFLYYLSPSRILKFDIDDLFYYSSRKIMRRGGHLFVSDYGMQVNIMNRYGIKNYAVEGRDYRFINGDSTDLRYENIEVWNTFHGVEIVRKENQAKYKVRIHVKSNYVVGTYSTITEAAIAYNKAADIVKKNGIDRNYPLNYIEGLSPAAYADIYSRIRISSRVRNLDPPKAGI